MEKDSKNIGLSRHCYFVTGRLAEYSLRKVVESLAEEVGIEYTIGVMPITVAALMTPKWLKRHLEIPKDVTEVILPGYCQPNLSEYQALVELPLNVGPKDLRDLPKFFEISSKKVALDEFSIEIIAEINHAPRHSRAQIETLARHFAASGADVIDLGCDPAGRWLGVADTVRMLCDSGFRVSIDTFEPREAADACAAGAELVLSVNSSNREQAVDWATEVVAIPDTPDDLDSLDRTIEYLSDRGVPLRIDPILEPIGLGFSESLRRYMVTRERYPDAAMMMGIGNLSELTDVDSAGVNFLLLGICQELGIQSVLTTEVINWARSSVRECDLARRMVYHSVEFRTPPKNICDSLVMLRDPRLHAFPEGHFQSLAEQIKDNDYRLFAEDGQIHFVANDLHVQGTDPFVIFAELMSRDLSANVNASHAFYLGFEMAKALTACTLGKQYEQDESLRWGHLTVNEKHHRLDRGKVKRSLE